MIIGSGLVAKALIKYKNSSEVLIFASGVSNSTDDSLINFEREKNLLLEQKEFNGKLIYFSTCSVFDKTLVNSPYVLHKLNMEQIISKNFKNYIILRLPTLVGISNNSHIFFNYFKEKLKKDESITVFKYASRYLLAAEDLRRIIAILLRVNKYHFTLNVAFNNKASVVNIVELLKELLKSDSELIIENKGDDLVIDNNDFIKIISKEKNCFMSTNIKKILEYYIF